MLEHRGETLQVRVPYFGDLHPFMKGLCTCSVPTHIHHSNHIQDNGKKILLDLVWSYRKNTVWEIVPIPNA